MRRSHVRLGGIVLAAASACGSSDDTVSGGGGKPPGSEGGPCRSGGECDPGLLCLSDLCVEPPDAGAGSGGTAGSTSGGSGGTSSGGTSSGGTATGGAAGTGTAGVGAEAGVSAGGTGSGGEPAAGGASGAGGDGDAGGVECKGTHPELDAGRFCQPGDCYCAKPDACFPQAIAEQCCEKPTLCGEDGGVIGCKGRHPDGDPGSRTCGSGSCLCEKTDLCFPAAVADACCAEQVQCF
jgi:hypothetical protein